MVRFALLGPLEAQVDGVPVSLGGPRQRAVLARLLVDIGRPVSSDALIEAVWDDRPPPTARKTLQKYIVELRKALGSDVVQTNGRNYVLRAAGSTVDAQRFELLVRQAEQAESEHAWERAAALRSEADRLWRGDALADFADSLFAAPERSRLHELRLSSLETGLELDLSLGRHAEVVARAASLVEREPLRERPWSSLVLALYRAGRQVEALRAYDRIRLLLLDEMGLDPSAELQALHLAVLNHDASLELEASDDGGRAAPALPRPTTSLLGRALELDAIEEALGSHRLVTLAGTGGVGKTRVAIESAHRAAPSWPGGCWFVDLSTVALADEVPRCVAGVLAIDAQPGEDPLDGVTAALAYRPPSLLVLDNCEHLLRASAVVVGRLLQGAPDVTILATSRQRLGVEGEFVVEIGPLPLVDGSAGEPSVAVRLFAERASSAVPGLELSSGDLVAAAEVCRRLDGIPLAIELAATQVRVLEPAQIAARVDNRLRFSGPTTASARQRTLEVTVDWSYELLSDQAQAVFERLAVFAGPCTLAGAEAVAPASSTGPSVLDAIGELVDASLLVRERGATPEARYRLLETLRIYGLRRLEESGLGGETRRAHARHFVELATTLGGQLFGPDEIGATRALRAAEPDLRAAFNWSSRHDCDLAARLVLSVWPYWSMDWRNLEGLAFIRPLVDTASLSPEWRAWVLTVAASLAAETGEVHLTREWAEEALVWFSASGDEHGQACANLALGSSLANQGQIEEAERVLSTVLAAARAAGSRRLTAQALEALGLAVSRRGDHEEARRRHQSELEAWTDEGSLAGQSTAWLLLAFDHRGLGDLASAVALARRAVEGFTAHDNRAGAAHALSALADVLRVSGDAAAAIRTYGEARAAFQANGDRRCLASTNKNLAVLAHGGGDHDKAASLFLEAMRLRRQLGDDAGLSECLEGLAAVAAARGRPAMAVALLAGAERLRTDLGAAASPDELAANEQVAAAALATLNAGAVREARRKGKAIPTADLLAFAAQWDLDSPA